MYAFWPNWNSPLNVSPDAESHCYHAWAGGLEPNRESFLLANHWNGLTMQSVRRQSVIQVHLASGLTVMAWRRNCPPLPSHPSVVSGKKQLPRKKQTDRLSGKQVLLMFHYLPLSPHPIKKAFLEIWIWSQPCSYSNISWFQNKEICILKSSVHRE